MTDTPLSDDVVERVAEALWRAEWVAGYEPSHSWDAMCSEDWDIVEAFRVQARAALEAARYGEMVEALRPFAAMAEYLDDTKERRDAIYCGGVPGLRCEITQADYHKARALLSSIGATHDR